MLLLSSSSGGREVCRRCGGNCGQGLGRGRSPTGGGDDGTSSWNGGGGGCTVGRDWTIPRFPMFPFPTPFEWSSERRRRDVHFFLRLRVRIAVSGTELELNWAGNRPGGNLGSWQRWRRAKGLEGYRLTAQVLQLEWYVLLVCYAMLCYAGLGWAGLDPFLDHKPRWSTLDTLRSLCVVWERFKGRRGKWSIRNLR